MQQRKEHKETKTADIAERKRQRINRGSKGGSTEAKKAVLNHRQAKEVALKQRQKKEAVNTMEATNEGRRSEYNRGRVIITAAEAEAEAKRQEQQRQRQRQSCYNSENRPTRRTDI